MPTRLGNSVSVGTSPDLAFTLNLRDATWSNLDETLGSDHYLISVSVSSPTVRRTTGQVRAQIHIAPLPKNMSPVYHRARRDARARKLAKQYGTDPDTLYTDAARCGTHGFSLAAVGSRH
ncbi:hypothetical protein HPB50_021391 [Hyalomma asiaticum]|uniref:Uncharacterized protein n=1 Tax=Hyalomma asiaticum TaxID=266040 RepID=A0ACB7RN01_HYAAI|nr:hypothetical protein HPB50_021391 [Hyalomma asiaticum]